MSTGRHLPTCWMTVLIPESGKTILGLLDPDCGDTTLLQMSTTIYHSTQYHIQEGVHHYWRMRPWTRHFVWFSVDAQYIKRRYSHCTASEASQPYRQPVNKERSLTWADKSVSRHAKLFLKTCITAAKTTVFWYKTQRSLADMNRRFRETGCLSADMSSKRENISYS